MERSILAELYGREARRAAALIREAVTCKRAPPAAFGPAPPLRDPVEGREALLIAYGDMLSRGAGHPLAALADFAEARLSDCFGYIHVLPFFPATSDGGFAVADYEAVDPALGGWDDIGRLSARFGLACDLVLNHASAESRWFREFLAGSDERRGWFLVRPEGYDASGVFRPRTTPLFTAFQGASGPLLAWTTFGPDQVDFDYSNPQVLAAFLSLALDYAARGASILRLDAIGYLWKEEGHTCLNHPKVHLVVRLLRSILDRAAPGLRLLTETNVPHRDNVAYFGRGDEAHLVYNFALPPLVLHSFLEGSAGALALWAASLETPPGGCAFVNFLASHDGIGVAPARGLLSSEELSRLADSVRRRGGLVSERSTPQGPEHYELNSTWLDAVADPEWPVELRAGICLSSVAVMLALAGLPALYFHLLVGSPNWREGAVASGAARDLNRARPDAAVLGAELDRPGSMRKAVFEGILSLLRARRERPAFGSGSPQLVLDPGGSGLPASTDSRAEGSLFALVRGSGPGACLAIVNCGDGEARCAIPEGFSPSGLPFDPRSGDRSGSGAIPSGGGAIAVPPHGTIWLDGVFEASPGGSPSGDR